MLDLVVDRQLPLLAALSEDGRRRSADYLAELVMLAQAYRYYAADWITRAELERRGRATVRRLEMLRQHRPSAAQFPEYD